MFDATGTSNPEHRTLTYQWRLAIRPASSAAALTDTTSPMISFLADLVGRYSIELRAFDGELWSVPAKLELAAQ